MTTLTNPFLLHLTPWRMRIKLSRTTLPQVCCLSFIGVKVWFPIVKRRIYGLCKTTFPLFPWYDHYPHHIFVFLLHCLAETDPSSDSTGSRKTTRLAPFSRLCGQLCLTVKQMPILQATRRSMTKFPRIKYSVNVGHPLHPRLLQRRVRREGKVLERSWSPSRTR
jgi:hypothetical protein